MTASGLIEYQIQVPRRSPSTSRPREDAEVVGNGWLADLVAGRDVAGADRPDLGELAKILMRSRIRERLQQASIGESGSDPSKSIVAGCID